MYVVSGEDKERIYCLKQMLNINPENEKAHQKLIQLLSRTFDAGAPPSSTPLPVPVSRATPKNKISGIASKNGVSFWTVVMTVLFTISICVITLGGSYLIYDLNRSLPAVETSPASESVIQTAIAKTQISFPTATSIPLTNTPQPTKIPDLKPYFNKVSPIMISMQSEMEEFMNLNSQIQYSRETFYTLAWRDQINVVLDKLLNSADDLESIEPVPPQVKTFDGYLDQIASEIKMLVANYHLFLDSANLSYLDSATKNIEKILAIGELANRELESLSNP